MKIDFQFDSKYGIFSDALYFEDDAVPDEATIEAMKQERFNNWIFIIENPPPPPSKYRRDENGNLILDEHGDPIPTGV